MLACAHFHFARFKFILGAHCLPFERKPMGIMFLSNTKSAFHFFLLSFSNGLYAVQSLSLSLPVSDCLPSCILFIISFFPFSLTNGDQKNNRKMSRLVIKSVSRAKSVFGRSFYPFIVLWFDDEPKKHS